MTTFPSSQGTFPAAPAAVLLAGGTSSRMGRCKLLLELGGMSALAQAVTRLRAAGVENVVIVTGHWRQEVEAEAARLGARTAHNDRYEEGMFSSVQTGAATLRRRPGRSSSSRRHPSGENPAPIGRSSRPSPTRHTGREHPLSLFPSSSILSSRASGDTLRFWRAR